MDQIIITSGEKFTDIDTLASSLAYSELLTKLGKDNTVVLPGPLNESITKSIKEWNLNYLSKLGNGEFSFVLIDISEKEFFSHFVKEDKIIEIYDHHFGFDKYWREKLKNDAHIEPVGSCATLIWEEYGKRKIEISTLNANLLYTAIFSNTLNFNSSVTTNRDREAFQNLLTYINLPDNWIETYYKESENEIFKNPINAIAHDIKTVKYGEGKEVTIGQIELWNSGLFVKSNIENIKKAFLGFDKRDWFLTSPSISESKNYICTNSDYVKNLLTKMIGATFDGDIGTTDKLWLRKEILKKLLEF